MLIEIPDEIINKPEYSLEAFMLDVAVMLYEQERISLAKAARWVGMNRLEFQQLLAARGVTIHYDLEGDLKTLEYLKDKI